MPTDRIVVIGGASAAVPALVRLLSGLPADLGCAVVVVVRRAAGASGTALVHILQRASTLPVREVEGSVPLKPNHVYLGRADCDTVVERDHVRAALLQRASLPIDHFFASAAESWGPRAVAVVLSAAPDDGALGAAAVRAKGGRLIVQDPEGAQSPGLARAVLESGGASRVVGPGFLADAVIGLLRAPASTIPDVEYHPTAGADPSAPIRAAAPTPAPAERRSSFACPECAEPLYDDEVDTAHLRCRWGHVVKDEDLLDDLEAHWVQSAERGLRALERIGTLSRRIATRMAREGAPGSESRFVRRASRAHDRARHLRSLAAGTESKS